MSSNPDRARIHMMGLATWTELEATVGSHKAAVMRKDAEATDAARQKAHDLLDHHLDLAQEGIEAIRLDVEKKLRDY